MATYVCRDDCEGICHAWTNIHESQLLTVVAETFHKSAYLFNRDGVEKQLLHHWTMEMHRLNPGRCFTKEMVLDCFSEFVMRHNVWTYITKMPGVCLENSQQNIYVPTVLKYGVKKVFPYAAEYFTHIELEAATLHEIFSDTEFDIVSRTAEICELREPHPEAARIDACYVTSSHWVSPDISSSDSGNSQH